ncbi:MAG: hypothetical protein AAF750_05960 [Planctomycetota bacterium]
MPKSGGFGVVVADGVGWIGVAEDVGGASLEPDGWWVGHGSAGLAEDADRVGAAAEDLADIAFVLDAVDGAAGEVEDGGGPVEGVGPAAEGFAVPGVDGDAGVLDRVGLTAGADQGVDGVAGV